MVNIESQKAYLLHSRKYTDSKILVDLFSLHYGRIAGVMRRPSGKNKNLVTQSFTPLLVSWRGDNNLKTITAVENSSRSFPLASKSLYCGFYLNEILQRCLKEEDPHEDLFYVYDRALRNLSSIASTDTVAIEKSLREFELQLLDCLGFGIDFETDIDQNPIEGVSGECFRYVDQHGFMPVLSGGVGTGNEYPGDILLKIRARDFSEERTLKYIKRLCRQALLPVIGDKPLKARELFR